jgi:hypothetical protein
MRESSGFALDGHVILTIVAHACVRQPQNTPAGENWGQTSVGIASQAVLEHMTDSSSNWSIAVRATNGSTFLEKIDDILIF